MPATGAYLTHERLTRLKEYTYSSIDLSPISRHVLSHWWTFAASLAPLTIAPNAVTLVGFTAIVCNVTQVAWFIPDLGESLASHHFVYGACAIGLFFYQTMDNVDGKQARRTGASSPLGELFDHGVDALNCPLGGLIQASAMGLGHSGATLFCVLVGCWAMYSSTWEEYHTGTLFLGYFSGPVEGLLIAMGILTTAAFATPAFWHSPLPDTLASLCSPVLGDSARLIDAILVAIGASFVLAHLPWCLVNVYNAPERRGTYGRALGQLLPMLALTVATLAWALSPNSSLLRGGHTLELVILLTATYAQMSTKVMLAQLVKGPFPYSFALTRPIFLGALGVATPYFGLPLALTPGREVAFLHFATFLACNSYAWSTARIIDAFCTFLHINALTLTKEQKAVAHAKATGREYTQLAHVD